MALQGLDSGEARAAQYVTDEVRAGPERIAARAVAMLCSASIVGRMIWDTSADSRSSSWRTARPTGLRLVTPNAANRSNARAAPAGLRSAMLAICRPVSGSFA